MHKKKEKLSKKTPVGHIILAVVATAGLISVAAVAPGVLYALKKLRIDKKLLNRQQYYINDSLERLKDRNLVSVVRKNGKEHIQLTQKGRKELFKFQTKGFTDQISKKWDGKYRVVIFDIKESERFARDEIRFTLLQCGFIRLQNSVWVYPYSCEGLIHLIRTHLEVKEGELVYMIVETIENDSWIRKHFKLPLK